MGFSCGLVGLPNAGKSTLFNALANAAARVEPYPFCTIAANIGSIAVPDERLDRLAGLFPAKTKVPTHLDFIDIAGLVERASEGEGMGNQFLSEIRAVDAILHVVRCFEHEDVPHVAGTLDPRRDIEIVETELLLKDHETLSRVAKRLHQETKGTDRLAPARAAAWDALVDSVARGLPVRAAHHRPRDRARLSARPVRSPASRACSSPMLAMTARTHTPPKSSAPRPSAAPKPSSSAAGSRPKSSTRPPLRRSEASSSPSTASPGPASIRSCAPATDCSIL